MNKSNYLKIGDYASEFTAPISLKDKQRVHPFYRQNQSFAFQVVLLLTLALMSFAFANANFGTEVKQPGKLKPGNVIEQNDKSNERCNMQFSDENMEGITKYEKVPADEKRLIKEMKDILQEKMSKDYPEGKIKRDAHPKNLAFLQAEFIVDNNIPAELKVGIFELPQTYPAWIRISSSNGKLQLDKVKDIRGFALKIIGVKGERFQTQNDEKETQDFLLLSHPTMPLGTVKLFHDAVYYSIKWHLLVFASRLILSGNFDIINELRKARQNQTSPLDIRYWSTTPYLCGADHVVKYSMVPTSNLKSALPPILTDHYLAENMEKTPGSERGNL